MEWQPINSAPKDGKPLILYSLHKGPQIAIWYSVWSQWITKPGRYHIYDMTHWMPLPPPPAADGTRDA